MTKTRYLGSMVCSIMAMLFLTYGLPVTGYAASTGQDPGSGDDQSASKPDWMLPPSYRYDPSSTSDPFVPFIRKEEPITLKPEKREPGQPLTPLQKIEVTQLKAIGILWYPEGTKETLAMVQLPDGKGFVLHKGMRIGRHNGIVDEITPEAIIVKERGVDILGRKKTRDVLIKLHTQKGDRND
ncbi:pilus assembly protein PilP [Desulfoplanes sp.]